MKKTSLRLLAAIVTIAALLTAFIPAPADAASAISTVSLDVRSDIAGLSARDYKDIITLRSENIQLDKNAPLEASVIYEETGQAEDYPAAFQPGKRYVLKVKVVPGTGFDFAEKLEVFVNGGKLGPSTGDAPYYTYDSEDGAGLCIPVIVSAVPPAGRDTPVENVSLVLYSDIVGMTAADYADFILINSDGSSFDESTDTPVRAWKVNAGYSNSMPPDDSDVYTGAFVQGETYLLSIRLVPKGTGYYLPQPYACADMPFVDYTGANIEPCGESRDGNAVIANVRVTVTDVKPNSGAGSKVQVIINQKGYYVDGIYRESDAAATIVDNRTFVPFRLVAEALGGEVSWNPDEQTVVTVLGKKTVTLTIGGYGISLFHTDFGQADGILDVAPFINGENRTMVPLRALAATLDCDVTAYYAPDGTTESVIFTRKT